ncbi:MAG: hypothetical protein ACRDWH_04335 [Acidimicrobiia bacterium]
MPTDPPSIPDLAPLINGLLEVSTSSIRRNSDQALDVWKQVANGEYEPKYLFRDAAAFWAGTTKDVAKTFVLFRDFFVKVDTESRAAEQ